MRSRWSWPDRSNDRAQDVLFEGSHRRDRAQQAAAPDARTGHASRRAGRLRGHAPGEYLAPSFGRSCFRGTMTRLTSTPRSLLAPPPTSSRPRIPTTSPRRPSVRPFGLPRGRATLGRRAARPGIAAGRPGPPGRAHAPRARDPPSRRRRPLQLTARPHALGHGTDREVPSLEHLSKARGRQPHGSKPVGAGEWPARRRAEPRLRQPPPVRYQAVVFRDQTPADLGDLDDELHAEGDLLTRTARQVRPRRGSAREPRSRRRCYAAPAPPERAGPGASSRQIQRVNRTISAVPGACSGPGRA